AVGLPRPRGQRGDDIRPAGCAALVDRRLLHRPRRHRGGHRRPPDLGSRDPFDVPPLSRGHGPLTMDRSAGLKGFAATAVPVAAARTARFEIEEFNTEYAAALDAGDIAAWPGFFTDDALYRITGRDNADADLPVGLVLCEGMGMLKDRAL